MSKSKSKNAAGAPRPNMEEYVYEPVPLDQARDRDVSVAVPRALLRRVVGQVTFASSFLERAKFGSREAASVCAQYRAEMEKSLAVCAQLGSIDLDDEDLDD